MGKVWLGQLFLGMLWIGGCAHTSHPHGGKLLAEYKPGDDPETVSVPYQANFVLYHWPKPPKNPPPHKWIPEQEVGELFVRGLTRHEQIGFEKDDCQLFAIAGEEKILLEEGRYCWHIHPSSEYRGIKWVLHETGERTVQIVSLPFGLAAAAIVLPVTFVGLILFLPVALILG